MDKQSVEEFEPSFEQVMAETRDEMLASFNDADYATGVFREADSYCDPGFGVLAVLEIIATGYNASVIHPSGYIVANVLCRDGFTRKLRWEFTEYHPMSSFSPSEYDENLAEAE